jgi:hypothetical protein
VTVPSTRQVARRRINWWEPDRHGAPLSPTLAYWIRRRTHARIPLGIMKGLARRGLYAGKYVGQEHRGLTPEGERLRDALGTVPERYWSPVRSATGNPLAPSEALIGCPACGKLVNAELFAWGAGGVCLACAQDRAALAAGEETT